MIRVIYVYIYLYITRVTARNRF